ncbi:MAG: nucleoside 2-deoxyribosyltransferase [Deltaproteobacteria bacterium]|nr:nucleoside 2-deoxyribosyltransferase [Deltaproteobacteria bacterium]
MKIYFAGPDIFWPDYSEKILFIKNLCRLNNLDCLYPELENNISAQEIVEKDLSLIRKADLVVANLNPFRGQEPDSGTVFECGYAYAKGLTVIGYLKDRRDMLTKLRQWPLGPTNNSLLCQDGSLVEDFGKPLNLMLSETLSGLYSNLQEAVEAAAKIAKS